jgi:hypothetical protein
LTGNLKDSLADKDLTEPAERERQSKKPGDLADFAKGRLNVNDYLERRCESIPFFVIRFPAKNPVAAPVVLLA